MTVTWDRLGPREKEVLAVLREEGEALATREVMDRLAESGTDVAYTTVGTMLDRLAEKGVLARERESYAGSTRYRYRFDPEEHRESLIEDVITDVGAVLGERGLERLERLAARESPAGGAERP